MEHYTTTNSCKIQCALPSALRKVLTDIKENIDLKQNMNMTLNGKICYIQNDRKRYTRQSYGKSLLHNLHGHCPGFHSLTFNSLSLIHNVVWYNFLDFYL